MQNMGPVAPVVWELPLVNVITKRLTFVKLNSRLLFFLVSNSEGFTRSPAISKRIDLDKCSLRHSTGNLKYFPKLTLFFKIDEKTSELQEFE